MLRVRLCNDLARPQDLPSMSDRNGRCEMTIQELDNSRWRRVNGVVTPGGDPYYECPYCGWGRCYGVEHPKDMPDACPHCGKIMLGRYDYLRHRITKIADNILALDGAYPTWDYGDLSALIDNVEKEYEGDKKSR